MPVTKIHLYSDRSFELTASGNIQYVYIFSAVAIFILLIACINFMNLTTARSANRAREVGIRKVLGTARKQLIAQFLTESTLMAILSLLIAITISWLVLPLFNDGAARNALSSLFSAYTHCAVFPACGFACRQLSFLSSLHSNPLSPEGKLNLGSKSGNKCIDCISIQTSIMLIIDTIVIYEQLNYIQARS
jgi:putative ABC transport system permease protein